ncbi:MAG: TlyA family rRNA (cytidine-2'-O)-methyltransferase [Phycisphaerae bacterium]|nr:TlyA family rRNA (cytidine-2'-O)-methyltransferase [Phycisphaerae bacterium]
MHDPASSRFVSRGGDKLAAALDAFQVDPSGRVCADLGSHVGGFVDCLLQHGALRVYSVDTSYGTLAWKLRRDARVVVLERTNAMHATLPEPVGLVTIDVGWTRQERVLPNVARMIEPRGVVISLIKPHYEAPPEWLAQGLLPEHRVEEVVAEVAEKALAIGWKLVATTPSPIRGHGGNLETLGRFERV